MSHKILSFLRQNFVLLIAVTAGLVAVGIYIWSGRASLDQSTRTLQNTDKNIEQISIKEEPEGQKNIEVKCADGSSYDVYIPPGQNNYDALAASKCQE